MSKSIDVYLSDFRIDVSEDGQTTREILDMSFGRDGHRTPIFNGGTIGRRQADCVSQTYPEPNGGAPMPFALFMDKAGREDVDGCAFHKADTFESSHGCIHLNETDASWLFAWAGATPVTVSVHGPYPPGPTRPQTYYDGQVEMLPRVIRAINVRLDQLGVLRKPVDSNYDAVTAEAVTRFQIDNHLSQDGKVGLNETAPALGVNL
jgi:hypothetical protein